MDFSSETADSISCVFCSMATLSKESMRRSWARGSPAMASISFWLKTSTPNSAGVRRRPVGAPSPVITTGSSFQVRRMR